MDMKTAIQTVLREKYVDFSGRAARSEFWWFILFVVIVSTVLSLIDFAFFEGVWRDLGPLSSIFSLIMLIPSIAVTARRLHDIGRSGWWQLVLLIPLIGFLLMIYWTVKRGTEGENAFGPDRLT